MSERVAGLRSRTKRRTDSPPAEREEQELRKALADADGSAPKAAVLLGVTRMTVWRRMKKYGVEIQRTVKAGIDRAGAPLP